ncbi:hypothetical protein GUITHDRAFT_105691 [Guillardia theta CCMP2712]|uniref:Uncharacterized protein n=1 Tax=Guillardia theta (strain CCMP2712) TaxID=905079 RepID=L1JJ44_GUITC|nr:hypothetical protein GUITHDRAFT_105691 [Guillardia theta CCMP2712]EKX48548.1 hypothetical protein GUITHDRAFT_105691 [Guillardia theta CCMP2712]|eukprot:XP_005835528.1 hypothetical protein GUITHDRAFT_105691 [Guillardia theta CCMP2712]
MAAQGKRRVTMLCEIEVSERNSGDLRMFLHMIVISFILLLLKTALPTSCYPSREVVRCKRHFRLMAIMAGAIAASTTPMKAIGGICYGEKRARMRFVVNLDGEQDSKKDFKLSAKQVRVNRRGKSEVEKSLGHVYLNTSDLVSESTSRNYKWKIVGKRSPPDHFVQVHASTSASYVKEKATHGISEDSEISEVSSQSETEETGVTEIKTSTDFLHSSLTYPSPNSMPLDFETMMNSMAASTPEPTPYSRSESYLDSVSPQSRSDDNNSPLNIHEKTFKKYVLVRELTPSF